MCDLLEYFIIHIDRHSSYRPHNLLINDMYQNYFRWTMGYIDGKYNAINHGICNYYHEDIFYNIHNKRHGYAKFGRMDRVFYINDEIHGIETP